MDVNLLTIIVMFAVVLAFAYAAINFHLVKRLREGNGKMQEIASAIREGANAFLLYEYRVAAGIAAGVAVLLALFIAWEAGIAFLLGAVMSSAAGYIGMKIAT